MKIAGKTKDLSPSFVISEMTKPNANKGNITIPIPKIVPNDSNISLYHSYIYNIIKQINVKTFYKLDTYILRFYKRFILFVLGK